MNSHISTFIGYHGTTKEGACGIREQNTYRVSTGEEEWLGHGVYFFQDDKQQAIDFCCKARRYEDYSIFKSEIKTNKYLDLDNKLIMEQMKVISKEIKGRYCKLKNGEKRKLTNSVILNFLYKIEPYDMVKKIFPIEKSDKIDRTNFEWFQIQLCVRNRECIYTIEEVD